MTSTPAPPSAPAPGSAADDGGQTEGPASAPEPSSERAPASEPDRAPAMIVLVEDESALAELVDLYLTRAGHQVVVTGDGHDAVTLVRDTSPDVVVLDLGLPGLDGVEVCRQLRTFTDCYVIMLTARDDEVDRLIGLSVGADDYVTKPFSPRELVARVAAMLRRPRLHSPPPRPVSSMTIGQMRIDIDSREVQIAGAHIPLTRLEFDILSSMAARPALAFSRRQIIEAVWGPGWAGNEHLVDVHIGNIRRKLGDDPAAPVYLRTVRGIGYRIGPGR